MEALAFRHVEFTYPNTDKKALDDVSFAVRTSEFIVICGKSGCGKSTLLRHMKKNMMPYGDRQGEILYEGHDLAELDNRVSAAEIGFVQQNPENQIVTDKVWHELSFGLESLGVSNQEIRRRVAEMASFFGIQSWFRRDVYELSGGQKQLLNLASIMAMQPKVLVLDEPTSQLDPIAATEFLETLAKINRELGTSKMNSSIFGEAVFGVIKLKMHSWFHKYPQAVKNN
jgi:energy-coupling factor transporter ATP-binding protein EcfA2